MMRVTVEESRLWLQSQTRKSRIRRVCIVKNARRCSPRTCRACTAISIYAAIAANTVQHSAAPATRRESDPGNDLRTRRCHEIHAVGREQNGRTRSLAAKPVDQKFTCLRIKTVSGFIHEQHAGLPTHAAVSRNFFRVTRDIAEKRVSRYESIPNPCTRLALSASGKVFLVLATNG